jgi:uncharacterized membrane-anchored protein
MSNKIAPNMFAPPDVEYDYSKYAGAGFPPVQPINEKTALELRQCAAEILAAEHLQTKESNKRKRNQRDKDIKTATQDLARRLLIQHGVETYTWPDGLSVRIEDPARGRGAAAPVRLVFNR